MNPQTGVKMIKPLKDDVLHENRGHIDQANLIIGIVQNPVRQQIMSLLLCEGQQSVNELCETIGVEQTTVYRHLGILRQINLVTFLRSGKYKYYSANENKMNKVMEFICQITPY